MIAVVILVFGFSLLLWFSVYGYFLILWVMTHRRHRPDQELTEFPEIAVVIPTLNEEDIILSKLKNLKSSDYPTELMTTLVIDGGSTDRTTELVAHEIERGEAVQLLQVEGSQGKPDQIGHTIAGVSQEIIVVTDADSILDPSCIRELVRQLILNPETAVIGATIIPDTNLLEERIHWKLLNDIWWLEGEVLSAASISGVCYACRRTVVIPPDKNVRAEDIHLAVTASRQGHSVRISRTALAAETRVPRTAVEFIRFRRRRGGGYLAELSQIKPNKNSPPGYRIARIMRLWHFRAVPKLAIGVVLSCIALLFTPYKLWVIAVFAGLLAPGLIPLLRYNLIPGKKRNCLKTIWAAGRLAVLSIAAMLTLYSHPADQGAIGGRS